jgi:hypothetical protein
MSVKKLRKTPYFVVTFRTGDGRTLRSRALPKQYASHALAEQAIRSKGADVMAIMEYTVVRRLKS